MSEFTTHLLRLYLEAAPWLLLGLIAAGLIKAWIADERLGRWLGGRGPWAVLKAALIGAPLPLCSCGVLPAALGLKRAGASREATLAFMIATPETGPDSIALSYALLGPFLAITRPVAAIASALFTGLLSLLLPATTDARDRQAPDTACTLSGGCCASTDDNTDESCCAPATPAAGGFVIRTLAGLRYAFTSLLDDLSLWLAIGLVFAALVATLVPPLAMAEWGSGLDAKLSMLLIGIPMYVCATASTPIAAGLLLAGISPGTVLVFLLAGPATNLATLLVVRREMGGATLFVYLAGIGLASLLLGIALDAIAENASIDTLAQLSEAGEVVPYWLSLSSGMLLALFAIKPLRTQWLGK